MPSISWATSIPKIVIIFLLLVVAFLSWWYYRRTVPPLPMNRRVLLMTLRWCGFSILLLLLSQPLISVLWKRSVLPSIVILVDNSKSMTVSDTDGKRNEVVRSLLSRFEWKEHFRNALLHAYSFDSKLKQVAFSSIDSLEFNGEETNLPRALQELKTVVAKQDVIGVVLISDGNSTASVSPLYEAVQLGVPIYTVGVGDTIVQRDIAIEKIRSNEVCYSHSRVPVHITVRSTGFTNERVSVQVRDESGTVAMHTVEVSEEKQEYPVELFFVPTKEGVHTYNVLVSQHRGEVTYKNNRGSFDIKVLKSKRTITVVAGSPSPDVAFMRRSLELDTLLRVVLFVQHPSGTIRPQFTPRHIEQSDCVFFLGYPTVATSTEQLQELCSLCSQMNKPLLWMVSRTVDFEKMKFLLSLVPIEIRGNIQAEKVVFPSIVPGMEVHPIIAIDQQKDIRATWSEFPPYYTVPLSVTVKPGAQVIAESKSGNTQLQPFIVVQTVGSRKSCVLLGYGLWRWRMLMNPDVMGGYVYDRFVRTLLQWLTTNDDEQRIRVQPVKRQFVTSEKVEFEAQLYDEAYRSIDNAEVIVAVTNNNELYECILTPLGNGQYEGALDQLPTGNYSYRARVTVHNLSVSTVNGKFFVGESSDEFRELTMNKQLLQLLATRTGGTFVEAHDIQRLFPLLQSRLSSKPVMRDEVVEIDLRSALWMLVVGVFIFTSEWILRRNYGLL
ncbi:MAG: VWA domain-containing protein [Bacteroidetes bacterium]|nr:VWA domain-containing protein [Bacteroidota bacterium]